MTQRRATAYALLLSFVGVLILAVASAEAHSTKRPADYPFSGNLEARAAWQTKAHAHAHQHIARLEKVLTSFSSGPTFKDSRKELREWKRVHDIVWKELQETRAALRPVVSSVSGSSGGSSGGCGDDGSYNYGLQFADMWLCQFPWLDGSVASQIRAAEIIGSQSAGDPWPNCDDPYDGSGASWEDTVACENGGDW
jgi:hypothetical protein